eukprot:14706245-Alexandrium_andersonii.AAC.1
MATAANDRARQLAVQAVLLTSSRCFCCPGPPQAKLPHEIAPTHSHTSPCSATTIYHQPTRIPTHPTHSGTSSAHEAFPCTPGQSVFTHSHSDLHDQPSKLVCPIPPLSTCLLYTSPSPRD